MNNEQERRPNATENPEKLRRHLRRINLMIPIDSIGLGLCAGALIVEGYDALYGALTGLLGIQLLFYIALRRDLKQQLATAEEFAKENEI